MNTRKTYSPEVLAAVASALERLTDIHAASLADGRTYTRNESGEMLVELSKSPELRKAMSVLKSATFYDFSPKIRRSRITCHGTKFKKSMGDLLETPWQSHLRPVARAVIRARMIASEISMKSLEKSRRGAGAYNRAAYFAGDCSGLLKAYDARVASN
jgi:hypothetical protein